MASAQTYELKLQGQKISLRSSQEEPEFAREVVALVSAKIAQAEGRLRKNSSSHQVALLALLDLAEEHIRARKGMEAFQKQVQEKSAELLSRIEAELE